jgi:hypothetical protein
VSGAEIAEVGLISAIGAILFIADQVPCIGKGAV